jgi:hypothetical protein
LKVLSNLKGPFKPLGSIEPTEECTIPYNEHVTGETNYFSDAGLVYQKWYENFIDTVLTQDLKDDTGTLNRFGDSVLKVAMLLALTRSPELYIDTDSMNLAIQYSEKLIGNVREMTHGKKGLSEAKNIKNLIIQEFLTRETHSISRAMLLKQMWAHYKDAGELDDIMLSFDQAGMIKTQSIGNQVIFVMPDGQVQEYKRRFAGKGK